MEEITLNNKPLSDFGATMLAGSYNSLLTPPQPKEWVKNESVNAAGTDYIKPSYIAPKERRVTLFFLIQGDNAADFRFKRMTFISATCGMCDLYVPDLNKTYTLKYEVCTSYEQHYSMTSCKLAIQFIEPKPSWF